MRKNKANKREIAHNVPLEVIIEILSWLPVKSVLRLKCVSHDWHREIRDPDFIRLHTKRSQNKACADGSLILYDGFSLCSLNFHGGDFHTNQLYCPIVTEKFWDPMAPPRLIGSCNGLLCFELSYDYAIYNPVTRAYKQLPKLRYKFKDITKDDFFVYDTVSDDYKVLRYVHYFSGADMIDQETHLYSFKVDLWEEVSNPLWSRKQFFYAPRSVVVNNFLHWLIDFRPKYIRRFDISMRVYDSILLPIDCIGFPRLSLLRGHLHIITDRFEIWEMKEYGVIDSWTRLFGPCEPTLLKGLPSSSMSNRCPSLEACSEDGRKMLVRTKAKTVVYISIDLDNQATSKIDIAGVTTAEPRFQAEHWVESMASVP